MSNLYSLDNSPVFCTNVWGSNLTSPYVPKSQVSIRFFHYLKRGVFYTVTLLRGMCFGSDWLDKARIDKRKFESTHIAFSTSNQASIQIGENSVFWKIYMAKFFH